MSNALQRPSPPPFLHAAVTQVFSDGMIIDWEISIGNGSTTTWFCAAVPCEGFGTVNLLLEDTNWRNSVSETHLGLQAWTLTFAFVTNSETAKVSLACWQLTPGWRHTVLVPCYSGAKVKIYTKPGNICLRLWFEVPNVVRWMRPLAFESRSVGVQLHLEHIRSILKWDVLHLVPLPESVYRGLLDFAECEHSVRQYILPHFTRDGLVFLCLGRQARRPMSSH